MKAEIQFLNRSAHNTACAAACNNTGDVDLVVKRVLIVDTVINNLFYTEMSFCSPQNYMKSTIFYADSYECSFTILLGLIIFSSDVHFRY